MRALRTVLFMPIPKQVQASTAVSQRQRFEGELTVKGLPRLAQVLPKDQGSLQVSLMADRIGGYPSLHGEVSGQLKLSCQRCEKEFGWTLDVTLGLRLVASDEEGRAVLESADPYQVEDDVLPLRDLVEDEVLLALPMLPRCETCENGVSATAEPLQTVVPRRDNPFAVLKQQLGKK